MQEGNEEPFNIRLHLAKDILTIQEQDVICVSGEPFYSSVSTTAHLFISSECGFVTLQRSSDEITAVWGRTHGGWRAHQ